MKTFLSILFLSSLVSHSFASPAPHCLDGFYDLGREAAALGFQCENETNTATIKFCHRQTLLEKGICTGQAQPINCAWNMDSRQWICEESGLYPFFATIERTSLNTILYKFKSKFSAGELLGTRIDGEFLSIFRNNSR